MLGIFSSQGQHHLRKGSEAEQAVAKEYGLTLLPFQESRTSQIDGVIVNAEAQVIGLYETKSRTGNLEYRGQDPVFVFRGKDYDSMLITKDKIDSMMAMSKALKVSAYLICTYSNDQIGVFKVTNPSGTMALEGVETKKVKTRATVVGGKAERENYFIPLTNGFYFTKEK